jgi:putative toxin-antitoxin system antitoxin component (TIGR02293 family)
VLEEATGMATIAKDKDAAKVDVDGVVERAVDVLGDREKALRWLGTPIRALNYATPISLLADPAGKERVMNILTRLEHGIP